MSVSVHDLQSTIDDQILEEISAAHDLSIFVRYRGRWIRGCRASSLDQATELAKTVFHRSGLPVEVRGQDGQPLFGIDEYGVRLCDAAESHSMHVPAGRFDPGRKFVCVR